MLVVATWGQRHLFPAAGMTTSAWVVDGQHHRRAATGFPRPAPWWPGSSYVTWVGIDGYYLKPTWTFASLFGPTIKAVRALTLDPILIAETGAAPAVGQPAKIANLFAGVRAYGLLGFVWFDARGTQDWRLTRPRGVRRVRPWRQGIPGGPPS